MGLKLQYRGKLDQLDRLPALCDELEDIAAAMGWETDRFDSDYDVPADAQIVRRADGAHLEGNLGLKGISLSPKRGGDTLWFCFDRAGKLHSLMGMINQINGTLKEHATGAVTETQFGGPKLHIWIVSLLRHLKKHYISDLEVKDESGYWDTGDADELRRRMNRINNPIEQIARETNTRLRKDSPAE